MPGPQAQATWVMTPSGEDIGAGVIARADVAQAKAKQVMAINLIIQLLP